MRPPLFEIDHPPRNRAKAKPGLRWQDEARFIKAWLDNPLTTGAVSPSGRALSRTMARYVDPSLSGPIIELGPGTGPVTEALIRRGVSPERLVLVEYDAAFCKLLARRYPSCRVVQGDAYDLGTTLRGLLAQPAAAVVSSLPLLTKPERHRLALLEDAFDLMRSDAPFIQFTYGLSSPMPKHLPPWTSPYVASVSAPVWLNLPPARVWIYRPASGAAQDLAGDRPDLLDKLKAGGEKLGDELREQREKLRAEFQARSAEARAEWKARTNKVKSGLKEHGARLKAARAAKMASAENRLDRRMGDKRHHG